MPPGKTCADGNDDAVLTRCSNKTLLSDEIRRTLKLSDSPGGYIFLTYLELGRGTAGSFLSFGGMASVVYRRLPGMSSVFLEPNASAMQVRRLQADSMKQTVLLSHARTMVVRGAPRGGDGRGAEVRHFCSGRSESAFAGLIFHTRLLDISS